MFEQEIELEKKSSSWAPLLLVIALILAIVGGIGYYVFEMRKGLTQQQAANVVDKLLEARPATVHFHAGTVLPSVDEKPSDPHYRLLEKAGVLKVGKSVGRGNVVVVNNAAEREFSRFPEFKTSKNADGTQSYVMPLAERKLVSIDSIKMNGPYAATVQYTWKWAPTRLGDAFDADGNLIKTFNTWDRGTLIQKYGADFFHAAPRKETVNMIKGDSGWKLAGAE